MATTHCVILSVLIAAALAKEISNVDSCPEVSADHCTISNIRITPCDNEPCILKRRHNASIIFDFTPNFVASNLQAAIYYVQSPTREIPFSEMSGDGCSLTTCPTVAGTQQTLDYRLYVGKALPAGSYPIKWKVWNADELHKDQACCFQTRIKIR